MTRILDIDMDFFLDDIVYWQTGEERLPDDYVTPWNEREFRNFLEQNCLLSKSSKIKGRIITHHNESFFFWEELISKGNISSPFEVTHIDAHSDLGLGDSAWYYILTQLQQFPLEQRMKFLDRSKVNLANYLAFAMSVGWIDKLNFVVHDNWDFNDFFSIYLKNFDDYSGFFEFRAYDSKFSSSYLVENIRRMDPLKKDPPIPYKIYKKSEFKITEEYDYLVFCQSPQYTPKTADFMLDILQEYIIEI